MKNSPTTFQLVIVGSSNPDHFMAFVPDGQGGHIAEHHFIWYVDSTALALELNAIAQSAAAGLPLDNKAHTIFGQRLFSTVFAGAIGDLWRKRLATLRDEEVMHVSICVDHKTARPFLNLPWECLHDGHSFLSLNRQTPFARLPWGQHPSSPSPLNEPLRLLVHITAPSDLGQHQILNTAREEELILSTLIESHRIGRIEIEFTANGSVEALKTALHDFSPHILHFVGHGVFDENTGFLWMETPDGCKREITYIEFAELITQHTQQSRTLRLIFLSACQSAIAPQSGDYIHLAPYLVESGIPAVIAMQFSIPDSAAMTFSSMFYQMLSHDQPVDVAFTEARNALTHEEKDLVDFVIPVLFLTHPMCLQVQQVLPQGNYLQPPLDVATLSAAPNFVGRRNELRVLQGGLDPQAGGWRAAVIYGLGGMGKTALALQVAKRMATQFEGVKAIRLTATTTAQTILDHLAAFLLVNNARFHHPSVATFIHRKNEQAPIEHKAVALIEILRTHHLLLIFDNYEDVLQHGQMVSHMVSIAGSNALSQQDTGIDPDLQKLMVLLIKDASSSSRFLFTSRVDFNPITGEDRDNIIGHIPASEMSFRDTVYLMETLSSLAQLPVAVVPRLQQTPSSETSPLSMRDLYERIGGHPYTIRLFAEYAQRGSCETALACIEDVQKELINFTLLNRAVAKLPKRARTLLQKMAIYDEPVPIDGLAFLMYRKKDTLSPVADEVQQLQHWSLLTRLPQSNYALPAAVREWARLNMDPQKRQRLLMRAARFWLKVAHVSLELEDYLHAHHYLLLAGRYKEVAAVIIDIIHILADRGQLELELQLITQIMYEVRGYNQYYFLLELIRVYTMLGYYDSSEKLLQEFLEGYGMVQADGSLKSIIPVSMFLPWAMRQSEVARRRGNYEIAKNYCEMALKIAMSSNNPSFNQNFVGNALHALGLIHHCQGEYQQAVEYYEQALTIHTQLEQQEAIIIAQRELGLLHYRLGHKREAVILQEKALNLARESENPILVADTLMSNVNRYLYDHTPKEAREVFEEALALYQKVGHQEGVSNALHSLGQILEVEGKYEEAEKYYNEALKIAEAMGDQRGTADTLSQLGVLYGIQGKYEQEQGLQERSLAIRREINDKQGIAISLHQLGLVHGFKKNFEQAQQYFEESITAKREIGDVTGLGRSLVMLGYFYNRQKHYEKAQQHIEEALIQFTTSEYKTGIAQAHSMLGFIFERKKEIVKAAQHTAHALIISDVLQLHEQKELHNRLFRLHQQMGEDEFQAALRQASESQENSQTLPDSPTAMLWDWITTSMSDTLASRHFLETHPELLDPFIEVTLAGHISSLLTDDVAKKFVLHLRYILREARRKGGGLKAIREAYIDAHGAIYLLEQPAWLNEIKRQLQELEQLSLVETFEKRSNLLQQAVKYALIDPSVALETLADLLNFLADTYQAASKGDYNSFTEAAITLYKRAAQIFTLQRYPRQHAMIQGNLGNVYAKRPTESKQENLAQAIAHYKIALTIFTHEYFPEHWAMTQKKLIDIYHQNEAEVHILGDAADDLPGSNMPGNNKKNDQELITYLLEAPAVSFASSMLHLRDTYHAFIAQGKPSGTLLRAMKLLSLMETKNMTEQRIQSIAAEVLGASTLQETSNWKAILADLEQEGFIFCKDKAVHMNYESYFDAIIDDYPGDALLTDCERAIPVLARQHDSEALLSLAHMLVVHGHFEKTIDVCNAIIKFDAQHARAYSLLASSTGELRCFEDAIKAFDSSLEIDPSQADTWANKGFTLGKMGKYELAVGAYNHALEIPAPPAAHANAWNDKGDILAKMGRNAEALEAFEHALVLSSDEPFISATALHNIGTIFSQEERHEEALLCYSEAIRLVPRLMPLWGSQAHALYYLNRYAEALASAEQAHVLEPDNSWVDEIGLRAASEVERMKEMLIKYSAMLRDNPDDDKAWYVIGVALTNLGQRQQALDVCEQLIQKTPQNIDAWILKGIILFAMDQYEQAVTVFNHVLELNPQGPFAQRSKERIFRIQSFLKRRREARAQHSPVKNQPLEERSGNLEEHAFSLAQLGLLAQLHGHYLEALEYLVQSLTIFKRFHLPEQEQVLHKIAELQAEVGDNQFAVIWKQVATGEPLPNLPALELPANQQTPSEEDISRDINILCRQVIDALYTRDDKRCREQAAQLEQFIKNTPLSGATHDFLILLVAWLHGEDIKRQMQMLHPNSQYSYKQMVAALSRTEQSHANEEPENSIPFTNMLVMHFVRTNWHNRLQLLKEHAEILLAEYIELIFDLLLVKNTDSDIINILTYNRTFLRRCRTWGIEPACQLELSMWLGEDVLIPLEHEATVMHIAILLSRQQEDATALGDAIEAMRTLLNCLTSETPNLFKAALLADLADTLWQCPNNHPLRKLDQIEALYREALTYYQTTDRLRSIALHQRSLGWVLNEQGRYEEAAEQLQTAIEGLQTNEQYNFSLAPTLSTYANVLSSLGRIEEALVHHSAAIQLAPDAALFYRARAETLIYARKLAEAEVDLAHAVELDENENSPYLWHHRVQIAIVRGEGAHADRILDEVVKRDASFDVAFLRAQAAWLQGCKYDPLLAYKKTQLAAILREERTQRQETEKQQAHLLEEYVQKDVKIAQLEAELAQYRSYLERLPISIQQQEHDN
jgi:tetratricopeptide (TPR) repeat protein